MPIYRSTVLCDSFVASPSLKNEIFLITLIYELQSDKYLDDDNT